MSQAALAAWVKAHYKLKRSPAQSTVSDILKKAALIMSKDYGDGNRRKPVKVTSAELETRLWAWIQAVEAHNVCLSRELIRMKARDIQRELCDAWELGFSDGWLTAFERRHRLRYRNRPGEAGSADPAAVAQGRQRLQEITDLCPPKDIYNMDETGLCYAMAPARSICTKRARGVKKKKTRITLAFTANADGTDALPVLFLAAPSSPVALRSALLKASASHTGPTQRPG
ncbi:Eukaryotic peptide chain release factor GTP-binding subunit [Phytophthora cinnamomi]|uniref:Eukaryotic peptide chain release factor GTP-binding subunit n=1 Tax=Phytophthora cinnamomi TaxID=4785 RepID=UPI00355A5D85|nr:Eukaryotic peptide chain release factor GTP-binding subunit [Phytophthora cinnamomi]